MRFLMTGSRDWTLIQPVYNVLLFLKKMHVGRIIVVHGAARGLDSMAGEVATALFGAENVEAHPADWVKYPKAAGPIRNQFMLVESRRRAASDGEHLLCAAAFHPDLANSKGTKDMVARLDKAGIPVLKIDG